MSTLEDRRIAVVNTEPIYPARAPFHPPVRYPELGSLAGDIDPTNTVYPRVREALHLLGLDEPWFGTDNWNPLGDIIHPGDTVLIKPNLVHHRNLGGGPIEAVITHGSVLRALADYALIALKERGTLIIGDAPQMDCNWDSLLQVSGIGVLGDWLSSVSAPVQFLLRDFRSQEASLVRNVVWSRKHLRDPKSAAVRVRLGKASAMVGIDANRLYGADYDRETTVRAHTDEDHEYVIAPEVISADVVISVPKLKVHSKVGTTLNLKNMVGINVDKNHLPHFRIGTAAEGGDECGARAWDVSVDRWMCEQFMSNHSQAGKYPYLAWRAARSLLGKLGIAARPRTAGGNWHGNDTAWRMTLDLNRILLCTDRSGVLHPRPIRRYFSMIDGIVGGQGDGPLHPKAYASGALFCGFNPTLLDCVATQAMGFDVERIPLYRRAIEQMCDWSVGFKPSRFELRSNNASWERFLVSGLPLFAFATPTGWKGAMECDREKSVQEPSCAGM